jgi:hypothetical protein
MEMYTMVVCTQMHLVDEDDDGYMRYARPGMKGKVSSLISTNVVEWEDGGGIGFYTDEQLTGVSEVCDE